MNYKEYSEKAIKTAVYPDRGDNFVYPVLRSEEHTSELQSH